MGFRKRLGKRSGVRGFGARGGEFFHARPAFGGAGNDTGGVVLLRWPLSSRNATQSSNMTSRDGVLYTRMWAFATSSTWTYPIRPSFPKSLPPAALTSMFQCKLAKGWLWGCPYKMAFEDIQEFGCTVEKVDDVFCSFGQLGGQTRADHKARCHNYQVQGVQKCKFPSLLFRQHFG